MWHYLLIMQGLGFFEGRRGVNMKISALLLLIIIQRLPEIDDFIKIVFI